MVLVASVPVALPLVLVEPLALLVLVVLAVRLPALVLSSLVVAVGAVAPLRPILTQVVLVAREPMAVVAVAEVVPSLAALRLVVMAAPVAPASLLSSHIEEIEMARWQLTEDHYIKVRRRSRPTEWEYQETDRLTGETDRTRFVVPLYCEEKMIISSAGCGLPSDNGKMGPIEFDGDPIPTPAMTPLDAEAEAISASYRDRWINPIESMPAQGGFNSALLSSLERQLAEVASRLPAPGPVTNVGVTKEEFDALKEQLAQLLAVKAERDVEPKGKRRVA